MCALPGIYPPECILILACNSTHALGVLTHVPFLFSAAVCRAKSTSPSAVSLTGLRPGSSCVPSGDKCGTGDRLCRGRDAARTEVKVAAGVCASLTGHAATTLLQIFCIFSHEQ